MFHPKEIKEIRFYKKRQTIDEKGFVIEALDEESQKTLHGVLRPAAQRRFVSRRRHSLSERLIAFFKAPDALEDIREGDFARAEGCLPHFIVSEIRRYPLHTEMELEALL